jgi:hypothetical protein
MARTPCSADLPASPVDHIPRSAQIRERLAALAQERSLLRTLLRLALRRERRAGSGGQEVVRA